MFSKEEAADFRRDFWRTFERYCREYPPLGGARNPFVLNKTGINHVDLKFDVSRDHVRVVLEVNHKNEQRRLDVYEYVEAFKIILEENLEGVIWNFAFIRENNQEVGRAYVELLNEDMYEKDRWPTIFEFMARNMILFQRNFMEIRDTLKKQIQHI